MLNPFKDPNAFGDYPCHDDVIEGNADGFTFTATIVHDDDMTPPWKRNDMHGVVVEIALDEWADAPVNIKILHSDHQRVTYYDVAASLKKAKEEGWNLGAFDNEKAIEADYNFLKGWCDDGWKYVGVVVAVSKHGVLLVDGHSLWGIESGAGEYLVEVANQLAQEAHADAKAKLEAMLVDFNSAKDEALAQVVARDFPEVIYDKNATPPSEALIAAAHAQWIREGKMKAPEERLAQLIEDDPFTDKWRIGEAADARKADMLGPVNPTYIAGIGEVPVKPPYNKRFEFTTEMIVGITIHAENEQDARERIHYLLGDGQDFVLHPDCTLFVKLIEEEELILEDESE